jgi:hypothetical protein
MSGWSAVGRPLSGEFTMSVGELSVPAAPESRPAPKPPVPPPPPAEPPSSLKDDLAAMGWL